MITILTGELENTYSICLRRRLLKWLCEWLLTTLCIVTVELEKPTKFLTGLWNKLALLVLGTVINICSKICTQTKKQLCV